MANFRLIWAIVLSLVAGNAQAQGASPDDAAWQAALAAGTTEAFESFLRQYPTSRYASEAFGRLVAEEVVQENPDVFGAGSASALLGSVIFTAPPAESPAGSVITPSPAALNPSASSVSSPLERPVY